MNIDTDLLLHYVKQVQKMRLLQIDFFQNKLTGGDRQLQVVVAKMQEKRVDFMTEFLLTETIPEKLIKFAHEGLTVRMGRPEYAPNAQEISEYIEQYFKAPTE